MDTFQYGDLVKIRDEWLQNQAEKTLTYMIVNVNEKTGRCYIEPVNCGLSIPPQELVGFNMIEKVGW